MIIDLIAQDDPDQNVGGGLAMGTTAETSVESLDSKFFELMTVVT
jgi:hypothetical protein